ncbi:MAG: BrnT family toxin [Methylorubrum populi]
MTITFDPAKRAKALAERGLDFQAAEAVFAGPVHEFEDTRADYGETRIITVGLLRGRMVIVGWTPRGADRHVFTMRKANDREQVRYAPLLR